MKKKVQPMTQYLITTFNSNNLKKAIVEEFWPTLPCSFAPIDRGFQAFIHSCISLEIPLQDFMSADWTKIFTSVGSDGVNLLHLCKHALFGFCLIWFCALLPNISTLVVPAPELVHFCIDATL